MRGRNDGGQSKRPLVLLCVMVMCLCLLFLYFSGSNQAGSAALEYGTKFSRSLGWGSSDGDNDDSEESIFGSGDADDVKLKSFPVCDERHSELIPCLDRNMIY
ncbi:hypothetical protein GUJ93_ZPchr0010g10664 [Zizania palustris]|uniref:Methyltransferase n=1 Tax=Zizania palustris TaxID=103762 RepID=A0A8J6BK52_ZIZPA|nr:hypothetical protein GUJ93_ZPchr0010g10664 [Zizania palustris]